MDQVDQEQFVDFMKRIMLIGFLYAIFLGCSKSFSCDDWANGFKNNFQANIVLVSKEHEPGIVTLKGRSLGNGKIETCEDDSKWLIDNFDAFEIGDTILKKRGEYTIFIKRKGKTISIPFKCNEKIYID